MTYPSRFVHRILALIAAGVGCAAPLTQPASAQSFAKPPSVELPASNQGLPGDGPIRRHEWFQKLWKERRTEFARNAARDRGAVVFLGDSITQGWGDAFGGSFPLVKTANRGISGDTTRGVLIRLKEDVLSLSPRGVVLLIGTNDLEERASPKTAAGNVRLILDALTMADSKMPIVLCEVFPSSSKMKRPASEIKELNALYRQIAKSYPQVTMVDTWSIFADDQGDAKAEEFPDLLHPNENGYRKWAAALKPVMRERGLLPES